jgi:hypothetical protein
MECLSFPSQQHRTRGISIILRKSTMIDHRESHQSSYDGCKAESIRSATLSGSSAPGIRQSGIGRPSLDRHSR